MNKKTYQKPTITVQHTEPIMAPTLGSSQQVHIENRGKLYESIILWADNEQAAINDPD